MGERIDTIPPQTTIDLQGQKGEDPWFRFGVTLSFNAQDSGLGVDHTYYKVNDGDWEVYNPQTPPVVTGEGEYTASFYSTDKDDNGEASKSANFSIDLTPPTISGQTTTTPNGQGWYNHDVTATFTASDALSGLSANPSDATVSNEGRNLSATGTACDKAGNCATATVEGINIDKTPPTMTVITNPPPNEKGWNNTSVTVQFQCSDRLSGVIFTTPDITLSKEGTNQQTNGKCIDAADNESETTSPPVNIDLTAPKISANVFPKTIWPPDNKMVKAYIMGKVQEANPGKIRLEVQDEYNQLTIPAQEVISANPNFNFTVNLLASRRSNDQDGRDYRLSLTAEDLAGNITTKNEDIIVPHDLRDHIKLSLEYLFSLVFQDSKISGFF